MLHHYLQKKEEEDLDIDQEEALSPAAAAATTGRSTGSPDLSHDTTAAGGQFAKKEEINYDWAQVGLTQVTGCYQYI